MLWSVIDLWLIENNEVYIDKFIQCAAWTLNKLDDEGRWDNFSHVYPEAPYSAMAQGEETSVQMQAMYDITGDIVFKEYELCWEKQYRNVLYKSLAFIVKAIQKIRE